MNHVSASKSAPDSAPEWDRTELPGPFDIIGDVHGCFDELCLLLDKLGYVIADFDPGGEDLIGCHHSGGRIAVFVGDIVDRGPSSVNCLRLVMGMCQAGNGLCVPGNHDDKFHRWLNGRDVKIGHGLATTIAEMEARSDAFRARIGAFFEGLPLYVALDRRRLYVAHAGLNERLQGRDFEAVRSFVLYGDVTGESDEYGMPVRLNWARDYRGSACVVYGHTPMLEAEWLNETICIDTGCVYGNRLTALRWPERELVQVDAARIYTERRKPLGSLLE